MTTQAPNWFREIIRDKIIARNKVKGDYLAGTMTQGDGHAGVVKFPVYSGDILVYKVTGAIQQVKPSNVTLDMVPITLDDYEATAWMRKQDFRKMGPSEQQAVADSMQKAQRFKKDEIRIDALNAFAENGSSALQDSPTTVETIGDGTTQIDLIDVIEARSAIAGTGCDEDLYYPIPEAFMDQLEMVPEFAKREYLGDKDLPFAQMSNVRKRTYRGVHMFTLPDKYFKYGTGKFGTGSGHKPFDTSGYIDTFMWSKEAMGSEVEWDQDDMDITVEPLMEGSPMLGKMQLSAAAVGLIPEGIKRLRFKAQHRATRIPTETIDVTP